MENHEGKVFIVIPAFNEAQVIGGVINEIKNAGYQNIIVVDDGSADKTAQIAKNAGAEVLNQIINRGQGAALRAGIEYLRENKNPDIVVTFDADGQHQVEDIGKLIKPVLEDECDIALGSRFMDQKTNVPMLRKLILKAGILFTNLLSNIKLTDTHNGLRALGKKAIHSIDISQRGMEHASEIIDQIKKNKLRYKEVPVTIAYTEYSKMKGQGSGNFFKLGTKIILKKLIK